MGRFLIPSSIILFSLGFTHGEARGGTINLAQGQTLEIDFTSDPTRVPCPAGPCDVLSVNVVLAVPAQGVQFTAELFGRNGLLGSTSDELFRSVTSLLQLGTVIDFTALQGPFTGFFDITASRAISVESALTNVDLGHGIGPAEWEFEPQTAVVNSVEVVPEPSSDCLLGVLLCCVALAGFVRPRMFQIKWLMLPTNR